MDVSLVRNFIQENYGIPIKKLTEKNYIDYYDRTVMIVIIDSYGLKTTRQQLLHALR